LHGIRIKMLINGYFGINGIRISIFSS